MITTRLETGGTPLLHHSPEAAHHIVHGALATHFFHHFLHLLKLLQQTIHILNLCPRAQSHPFFF